ncbi:CoB--CoM heterodisulfide reductase iron-sulfur subunit B family protein [Metallumcola ferriviriculae]|uniref:CoB--CoM heterodisulfide reductase iron-sulfur subunit B family protein n=1 Tax=Metallumcola ferriviriculae TaxID=3039180 RepID=A0AAU0UNJ3_9FIRM|nr:CoB--CoM heterodisulfide reductase iron-sulfur subunit B family protein [Desulfitibacteraceae bacterium MK1]
MKYAYYPGCSLNSTGIEYNVSAKAVAKHLGLELWEIPEWNCCGASAAHNTDHLLSLALPARNLAIAEKEGLDVAVPCAACFNRLKATQQAVRQSSATKETINSVIEMEYQGTNDVLALSEALVRAFSLESIKEKVVRPLTDLKAAVYYGCLLVRPPELTQFDDAEDPQSVDNIITALGADPVNWAFKVECCGAGHSTTRPDVGLPMIDKILADAKANGADCVVTACPLCFLNLDMRQKEIEQKYDRSYQLPIFYFTELMGLAFGYSTKDMGVNKHFVNPMPLLEGKDLLRHPATRRDEA